MGNWVSIYTLAPLLGWFVAHLVKFIVAFAMSGGKERGLDIFVRSGGMPSSHTAVMVSILTVIGVREGVGSAIFGLAVAITAIVIYDALNVRRSVGEIGDALKKVASHTKADDRFRVAYGHTPLEVIAGASVGAIVAAALLQIL